MLDAREDPHAIAKAVERAASSLRERNRCLGLPLVIWRDGEVQHVDPVTLRPVAWPSYARDDERPPLPPT